MEKKDFDFVDDRVLETVMLDVTGRKFVWQLLERANPFELSYAAGDATLTAFNEGRRFYGTNLLAQIINKHQSLYFMMVRENQEMLNDRRSADEYPGS